jgi:hypothetical protein
MLQDHLGIEIEMIDEDEKAADESPRLSDPIIEAR